MIEPVICTIHFEDLEAADAGRAADGLKSFLQDADPYIKVRRIRADEEAMDFGTVLAILSAPAVSALVEGISNWLVTTHSSNLTFKGPGGEIILEKISARNVVRLAELLRPMLGKAQ
jgi:hypothetical protein